MSGISPEQVADDVRLRLQESKSEVNAYWVVTTGGREAFATELRSELAGQPVVVIVIRDDRFTNPNSVLADLVSVIEENREACDQELGSGATQCGFVLVSRSELGIPQVSSPITPPAWFPVGSGSTLSMRIEDLTWTAQSPLSGNVTRLEDLAEVVVDVQLTVLRRLEAVRAMSPGKVNSILELMRKTEEEPLVEVLPNASKAHEEIKTPSAFRPSLRGSSMVCRLWRLSQERSPEQLLKPAGALANGLDLPSELGSDWHESLAFVLRRPSGGERKPRDRFAKNLILTAGAACQLLTAAAHSDDYAQYPILLLRTTSFDIRTALGDAEATIAALG